jgi:hypothetical protein
LLPRSPARSIAFLYQFREEDLQAKVDLSNPYIYFYQETIYILQILGEFCILITTIPKQEALQGHEVYIVFMLYTSFKGSQVYIPFLPLSSSESFWGTILLLNIDKLQEYTVYIFNILRQQAD